jgi:hypothetical protein
LRLSSHLPAAGAGETGGPLVGVRVPVHDDESDGGSHRNWLVGGNSVVSRKDATTNARILDRMNAGIMTNECWDRDRSEP